MPVIRIILLLVVLGGLALMLVQNWSPVLPLVFLGGKTQALPLAVWILSSVAAGAFTSLFITSLFKLSNYFARPSISKRRNVKVPPPHPSAPRSENHYTTASRAPKPDIESTSSDASDDWESDPTSNDDNWDFEDDADKTQNVSSQDPARDSKTYEASTEPKSGYRTGSVYSYNYREPSNSGVGKTESIYDADYRVIMPPYRQPDPAPDNEDWGFEDDDDFKDEDKR